MRKFTPELWFWLLLFCSCPLIKPTPAQPVACVSKCGLTLLVPRTVPAPACEDFQAVEDGTVRAFATINDPRFADACRRLSYFTVEIGDPVIFHPSAPTTPLAGVTMCEFARIFVGHRDDIRRSALGHEMGHAVSSCDQTDHAKWGPALRDAGFPE